MSGKASSSTEGFFQTAPVLGDPFVDDEALQRTLKFFLPSSTLASINPSLAQLAKEVLSPHILSALADAERNPPHLVQFDSFGRRTDQLVTSSGWRTLQSHGISRGIVAVPFENAHGQFSRLHQFALYHIWTPSSAIVTCPSAMTDGAAKLLVSHRKTNPAFDNAYNRLTSRDSSMAWTSGQWMTERTGGSDVSGTETVATYDPTSQRAHVGPWSISGFKWFSSATDADMSVLLAQTPKGLSLFYAPMREHLSSDSASSTLPKNQRPLNGLQIQRLKSKLGTRALPTAELVLKDVRAHLIGVEGQGIRAVSTVLNITRVHNAMSAVGFWSRGLAVSRAYAKVRTIKSGKQTLLDTPAHVATLAANVVEYRANMMLAFMVVSLLGREEEDARTRSSGLASDDTEAQRIKAYLPSDSQQVSLLLRVLTPVAKALTAKSAIHGLQECMESLGGVGYLENEDPALNIARLFRDTNVLSIWEGTTDIMADDMIRVVKGKNGKDALEALERWLEATLDGVDFTLERLAAEVSLVFQGWRKDIETCGAAEAKARGREKMKELGWIVCAALLIRDASGDGTDEEGDAVAAEVAKRWFKRRGRVDFKAGGDWEAEFRMNQRLVIGADTKASGASVKSRL